MKTSDRTLLKGYYWNHDAIRKDVVRIQTIIEKINFYNAAGFCSASQWFDFHCKSLLFHHHGEDDFFFPELLRRFPDLKDQMQLMDQQHKELDKWMFAATEAFKVLADSAENAEDKENLRNALSKYCAIAIQHLNEEEPIVEEAISRVPVDEVLTMEKKYMKELPIEVKEHTMPWMLDAMDEKDRKFFMRMIPWIGRVVYRLKLKGKYNRLVGGI